MAEQNSINQIADSIENLVDRTGKILTRFGHDPQLRCSS